MDGERNRRPDSPQIVHSSGLEQTSPISLCTKEFKEEPQDGELSCLFGMTLTEQRPAVSRVKYGNGNKSANLLERLLSTPNTDSARNKSLSSNFGDFRQSSTRASHSMDEGKILGPGLPEILCPDPVELSSPAVRHTVGVKEEFHDGALAACQKAVVAKGTSGVDVLFEMTCSESKPVVSSLKPENANRGVCEPEYLVTEPDSASDGNLSSDNEESEPVISKPDIHPNYEFDDGDPNQPITAGQLHAALKATVGRLQEQFSSQLQKRKAQSADTALPGTSSHISITADAACSEDHRKRQRLSKRPSSGKTLDKTEPGCSSVHLDESGHATSHKDPESETFVNEGSDIEISARALYGNEESDSEILTSELSDLSENDDSINNTSDLINLQEENRFRVRIPMFSWQDGLPSHPLHQFDQTSSGINFHVRADMTEVDFFLEMLSEDIVKTVVEETNRYAFQYLQSIERPIKSYLKNWTELTVKELYVFFAVTMLMVRSKRLELKEYWSNYWLLQNEAFPTLMLANRYLSILNAIRFCNDTDLTGADKLFKVRKIMNLFRSNFRSKLRPFENLCIVERVCKQYIKEIRQKSDLRFFTLRDISTGFVLDYAAYTGDESDVLLDRNIRISGSIVMTLLQPYINSGHTVFADTVGTIERSDVTISSLDCVQKRIKWPMKLFFRLLDISVWNAHTLYKLHTRKDVSLINFHLVVISQLIEKCRVSKPQQQQAVGRRVLDVSLRLVDRHFPSTVPSTVKKKFASRKCYVCAHTQRETKKRRETRYMCAECDVALCIDPCFRIYHTMKLF